MNWYLFIYLWSLTHHPVPRPVYYPPPVIRPAPVVVQPPCEWVGTGSYPAHSTCVPVAPTTQAPACEWVSSGGYGSKAVCVPQ